LAGVPLPSIAFCIDRFSPVNGRDFGAVTCRGTVRRTCKRGAQLDIGAVLPRYRLDRVLTVEKEKVPWSPTGPR
jgi:hypothetical protein